MPYFHLSPKDTSVSGVQPGYGLVLVRQWAMQAFFPTVGSWVESLPSHASSWACFTHTIDCRWCSGLSPADLEGESDTSLSGEEHSGDQTEAAHVLSSLTLSSSCICQKTLWTQQSSFSYFNSESENWCTTNKHSCFSCRDSWTAIHALHIPRPLHLFLLLAN